MDCTVSGGLFSHPKFLRMCADAGVDHARGLLLLVSLWQGAIARLDAVIGDAADVERCAGWTGERGRLVAALLEAGGAGRAGLIEPSECGRLQVHDLWEWAPEAAVKRWRRRLEGRGVVRRRMAPNGAERQPPPSPPLPLSPFGEREKQPARVHAREAGPDPDRRAEFAAVLEAHPPHRRGDWSRAWSAWLDLVRGADPPSAAAVHAAQARARAEWEREGPRYVPHLDRWLRSIRDWLQDRPPEPERLAPVVTLPTRRGSGSRGWVDPLATTYASSQESGKPGEALVAYVTAAVRGVLEDGEPLTRELERYVARVVELEPTWAAALEVDQGGELGELDLPRLGRLAAVVGARRDADAVRHG